jgi:prefoldin subunit 5
MKNKLIVIGWLGMKRCYLNISREEAIERYKKDEEILEEEWVEIEEDIKEFQFEDEFYAYDAGEK